MNYILIDTSYLIFYRYFALLQWWRVAHPDDELGNPGENKEFCEKFVKQIVESVDNIKRSLKLHSNRRQNPQVKVLFARDCPRKNIWRNGYFTQYKATREKDDDFMGGQFFKMVYHDKLLEQTGADMILYENYMQHAEHFVRLSENFSQSSNSKNNSNSSIDQAKISKINNSDTKEEKQVVTDEN